MATRVFISYRREDSSAFAGRVADRLVPEFGREALFMDVDAVRLGVDFVEAISDEVAK
jgi:TIR domain